MSGLWAQLPLGVSYQAVARQGASVLSNTPITLRFSLRQDLPNGPDVYVETQPLITNTYGLFSAVIGDGNVNQGFWNSIDWGNHLHFLHVEADLGDGNGFYTLGTQQIEAVPYSFYAQKAHMGMGDLLDTDLDSLESGMILRWDGAAWQPSIDQNTTYGAGNGIQITANHLIHNTGDLDPADDMLIGSPASGDLSGTYPAPLVSRVQGQNVSAQAPAAGQVWKWNGTSWVAQNDDSGPWTANASGVFYNSGSVGIGLNQPQTALHLAADKRALFGNTLSGSGEKMLWLPDRGAFRAGTVSGGIYSTYWDLDSIGEHSAAFGRRTKAGGFASFAAGNTVQVSGNYAFGMGADNMASGDYAAVWNRNNTASGLGASAMGYFNESAGDFSVSMGRNLRAEAYASLVIGRYNIGGGTPTQWISNDTEPVLEVGIGASIFSPDNALTIYKSGLLRVHHQLRLGSGEELWDGGSFLLSTNAHIAPEVDGSRSLGRSANRWNTVYALNGIINTSDLSEKQAVQPLDYGLAELMALRPVSFEWRDYPEQGRKIGLIAQDVQAVIPEVVVNTDWEVDEATGALNAQPAQQLGVYYADLIPLLIQSVQEQQAQLSAQSQQISQMQTLLIEQSRQLEELRRQLHP